ncbi:uncharacterized protein LOC107862900 isoform X1 [Capsicum annuum]|uniref:uncharacterized protein LOC107862900 isoform X1 n=1 Tax=Capsicum annuum TaxID=4072 RepID=UPI001FB17405|nr:uncharacterized protein LOC107862900 isoform X1 [Capsicum annuum]
MTKAALFVRPNVAVLCIRRWSTSVQPRVPSFLKCYSISSPSYRPMNLLPHIRSNIEADFAGRRSFSIRATSDTGSFDSPLMQSMEKKLAFLEAFQDILSLSIEIRQSSSCLCPGWVKSNLSFQNRSHNEFLSFERSLSRKDNIVASCSSSGLKLTIMGMEPFFQILDLVLVVPGCIQRGPNTFLIEIGEYVN